MTPHSPMKQGLNIREVSIWRGYSQILEKITFDLHPGEILHVKGVNGCGKTTLLKAIAGLLKLHKGKISFHNRSLCSNDFYWLSSEPCMKSDLTLLDNLGLWNRLEGGNSGSVSSALKGFQINHLQKVPFKHLSKGQQQRGSLSRLLLKKKPLWLLDEPELSLDRAGKTLLTHCIQNHCESGGMVVFTSHQGFELNTIQEIDLI